MKKTNYLSALCISLLFSLSMSVFYSCDKNNEIGIDGDRPKTVDVINIDNAVEVKGTTESIFKIPQEGGTYRFVTKKSMLPDPSLKDSILPLKTGPWDNFMFLYSKNVDWTEVTYKNDTITCTFTENEGKARICKTVHNLSTMRECEIKFIQKGEQE